MRYLYIYLVLLSFSCAKNKFGYSCDNSKLVGRFVLNGIYEWNGLSDCTYTVLSKNGSIEIGYFNDSNIGSTIGNGTIFISFSNIGDLTPININHKIRYEISGNKLTIL